MAEDEKVGEILGRQAEWFVTLAPDVGVALLLFLLFVLIGWVLGRAVKLSLRRRGDRVHASFLGKLPVGIFGFVGIMVALEYLGLERLAGGMLAGGGATAIIVGFAFREIGENFLAGLFLAFSRPFRLGDLIQCGNRPEGVVQAVDLRTTHIRTGDGRDIYIPNARVFNEQLVNFTRDGLRRPTFRIGVDYRTPLGTVCTALLPKLSAIPGVLSDPPPRVLIADFPADYALLEVQVWINTIGGTDFGIVQSKAMDTCRELILESGWTLSADVSTVVELSGRQTPS